jgi:hypothetical protein
LHLARSNLSLANQNPAYCLARFSLLNGTPNVGNAQPEQVDRFDQNGVWPAR